ncbi:MAG: ABC transporter permease subunit [Spirochaetia bacterium]|jgi:NitT/TauT family transport system permease protein|nr:ABC transporter permease subunit [Spirochaetia bacterium]
MTIFGKKIPMFFALFIWMIVWEIIGRMELLFLIPPFTKVLTGMWELLGNGKFHAALGISFTSFLYGMGLAIVIGIPLGVLMGRIKLVDELAGMWVNVFVSAPLSAVIPALMVLLGFGQTTVIFTVMLFAVWIITIDTRAGVKNISPSLIEMSNSYGAGKWDLYSKVIFWAALPEILAGLRLGLIRGVRGVVVGQLLIAIVGLGELFELYSRNFLMDLFWALVVLIFMFAYVISEIVNHFEQKVEFYAGQR